MSSVAITRAVVPLRAPLPAPRRDDLLAVSPPLPMPDETHWLDGVWTGGDVPGPVFTHDPCEGGTDRVKSGPGEIATQTSRLFTAYLPAGCMAQGIGQDPSAWIARATEVFRLYERAAVERVLATGDGHAFGPALADGNMDLLAPQPVDSLTALRLLENAIAVHGTGVIHASPSTVTSWDALNVTVREGDLTVTKRGTPVAVGVGYLNVVPVGQDPLTANQRWAFASGPVEIHRSDIDVPASSYEDMLSRSTNEADVLIERTYVLNWLARQSPSDADHVQAGVLIDETSTGDVGTFVDMEVPAGDIDGINAIFTLAHQPVAGSLHLYKNGLLESNPGDYALVGTTITFALGNIPQIGDIIVAAYRTD